MLLFVHLALMGFRRNTAYMWTHMLQNIASVIFGYIYIALWQAVAPEHSVTDPYTRTTMVAFVVLAQSFSWVTTFLPQGLGIQTLVRNGNIATEITRPVSFLSMTLAREAGTILYQALYRASTIIIVLAITIGVPAPASPTNLALTFPSLILGSYVGLTLFYTVGISSLWTIEVRWAHYLNYTLITLLSGGWIPSDMLPGWIGKMAPYLPFATQLFYPIRLYLGLSGPGVLLIQIAWALLLTLWCVWITRKAFVLVTTQGG